MTTHNFATIDGRKIFYREAGPATAPAVVLLHGFPSSSHMFRDLIPKLAGDFRVIAPDYLGFGYSDQPGAKDYHYTFDNLAGLIEKLLFEELKLSRFAIFVQDYGAPVGFRIASHHPEAITGIVVQNGNAYVEGISAAFEPLKAFWKNRTVETEQPVRDLLTGQTTRFQYTHGAKEPSKISPTPIPSTSFSSTVRATMPSNSTCSTTTHRTLRSTTSGTPTFASTSRRC